MLDSIPVFKDMAGQAAENSLVGYRNSIVVENGYGYSCGFDAAGNMTSTTNLPGFERVDIGSDGKLRKVWENTVRRLEHRPDAGDRDRAHHIVERQKDPVNGCRRLLLDGPGTSAPARSVCRKLAGTGHQLRRLLVDHDARAGAARTTSPPTAASPIARRREG